MLRRWSVQLGLCLCWVALLGCGTSKWALDNPKYADKYDRPYSGDQADKWYRLGKQMSDARHVRRQSGAYASFGASNFEDDNVLGGELGYLGYSRSWLSGKIGLLGMMNSASKNGWLAGVNTGLQVSPPTRLAPYAGVGGFVGAGWTREDDGLNSNGIDDDGDGTIDNSSESAIKNGQAVAAIYPELGVNYWINGRTRLNAGASYWFNTLGRSHDFWYYGVGLTFSFGPGSSESSNDSIRESDDRFVEELPPDWKPDLNEPIGSSEPDVQYPNLPVPPRSVPSR